MAREKRKEGEGLFKSFMLAYVILLLHVVLAAALGIVVIFFRGIVNYMFWIFLIGSLGIFTAAFLFYKRMKAEGKTLREMLHSPLFGGRPVEVSLLGGLVAVRMGRSDQTPLLELPPADTPRQLESPGDSQVRDLTELARLLENGLLTSEEYQQAKTQLLGKL